MKFNYDKAKGAFWGVVCGDMLGVPLEFLHPLEREPVTTPRGGGPHNQPLGTWSDDSSLTLCLADSLCNGYDPVDIGHKFLQWKEHALWTSHDFVFDIGMTTRRALEKIKAGYPPHLSGSADEDSNGNGSLMRIIPAALYFHGESIKDFLEKIHTISALTHGHPRSLVACGIYCLLVRELIHDQDIDTAWSNTVMTVQSYYDHAPFKKEIDATFAPLLSGNLFTQNHATLRATGYVVDTLNTAVFRLLMHSHAATPWQDARGITVEPNLASTILGCVNHGGDPDTVGAVGGGLAGAAYGYDHIPDSWLQVIVRRADIASLVDVFLEKI
ncbi:MAG: ADP-ribosylglycohydrolase family protein [Spirochaetales bacterium]|nr:ADP-ribosylglycohydrolase family protein [Spirochaetales bacterium]